METSYRPPIGIDILKTFSSRQNWSCSIGFFNQVPRLALAKPCISNCLAIWQEQAIISTQTQWRIVINIIFTSTIFIHLNKNCAHLRFKTKATIYLINNRIQYKLVLPTSFLLVPLSVKGMAKQQNYSMRFWKFYSNGCQPIHSMHAYNKYILYLQ